MPTWLVARLYIFYEYTKAYTQQHVPQIGYIHMYMHTYIHACIHEDIHMQHNNYNNRVEQTKYIQRITKIARSYNMNNVTI